jgi:hypothetical protein
MRRRSLVVARAVTLALAVSPAAGLGAACAVKLIGDYDEAIDHSLTAFYLSAETHFARLVTRAGTPEASYASNLAFYEESQASLSVVRLRALASPGKEILAKQVDLLSENVEKLRQLHLSAGDEGLPAGAVEAARGAIAIQVQTILKLELALKRGRRTALAGGGPWAS